MKRIGIIGDGGWGTALAVLLCGKAQQVVLWSHSQDYAEQMRRERENRTFLKGVTLPENLNVTSRAQDLEDNDLVIFAVPCKYMQDVARRFAGIKIDKLVSATKGIDRESLKRPSELLKRSFQDSAIGVLSGPSIAYEVARRYPTTVVLAMPGLAGEVQGLLMSSSFRVYTSSDMTGVELGGALKNIIAIAAGISDGLGYGANSKAGILTRGLVEITRLGVAMGAKKSTFGGLSGLGDLATTCLSDHSRNRWFGERLAAGDDGDQLLSGTDMVVEGYFTAKSAYELSKRYKVEMPITENVYEILYEKKAPEKAVKDLMLRDPKEEDYC